MSSANDAGQTPTSGAAVFQWAYIPLGAGGFYSLFSCFGLVLVWLQRRMMAWGPDLSAGMPFIGSFHSFFATYLPILLIIGALSAIAGFAMLNKWRIASWILGVSAALGLFGYAYFYSMAVRAVLTDFYRYVNTLASPGAMREVFRVFESSAGPVSVVIPLMVFVAPGTAIIVALAMAEKRTAPTGPLPLERPPRSSRR